LFLAWTTIVAASIVAPLASATAVEARRDVTTGRVAVGYDHGCAVTPAGGVECWGDNQYGELGVAPPTDSVTPVEAQLPVGWQAVAVEVGEHHTCALLADGGIGCWGWDIGGQLGDGPGDQSPGPVRVQLPTHRSAVALSAGPLGTCAVLDDGTVVCWGAQSYGELGQVANGFYDSPQSVLMPAGEAAVAIGTSYYHSCALLDTGAVTCWGRNTYGQFGNGTTAPSVTTGSASTPVLLAGGERAVALATGYDATCAVSVGGRVNCWGYNADHRVGDGTDTDRLVPTHVALNPGLRAVEVDAGERHACALVGTGAVYCWGMNAEGEVGDGTTQPRPSPVLVTTVSASRVVALEAGSATSCALLDDGTLRCWGDVTPATPHTFPTGTRVVQAASGGSHTCALNSEGLVWCWGQNLSGQLGRGTVSLRELQPADPVTLPGPGRAKAITAGTNHTCALLVDGSVSCWGSNSSGQLGVGVAGDRSTPSDPIALQGSGRAKAISAGGSHTCALHTDGTIACWGYNLYGQLGDGGNANQFATHDVVGLPGGSTAVAVTAGLDHTCALKADGAMACWGRNGDGQLGDTTTGDRPSAVTVSVPPGTRAVAIDAGRFHTCALFGAGTVTCWGYNQWGQLGVDPTSTPQRSAPSGTLSLPGGPPTQAIDLSAGDSHTCVLLDDGTAACWGYNGNGELGDGTLTTRFAPATTAAQPYGSRIRSLSAGFTHHCAVLDDGSMSCWGQNFNGQLGTGDRIDLSSPDRGGRRTMPTALAATTSSASVVLRWTEPTSPYGPQTWDVEGSTDGVTWWPATVSVTSPLGTTVSGLTNGVAYRFRVAASTPLDSITISLVSAVTPQAPPVTASVDEAAPTLAPTQRWPFAPAESITSDEPADVAAAMSRRRFAAGSGPTVHVVLASRTVDAAAAGAAAVSVNGPVLVVEANSLPTATAAEIRRLATRRVVVVGGSDAIGDAVMAALDALDGVTVTRLQGDDRVATAASVSRATFAPRVDTVYLVAGRSPIDGLGLARFGRPILLTERDRLPSATADELRRLRPTQVVVIGGTSVVSAGVVGQVEAVTDGAVVRWAGVDRFATTARIAAEGRTGLATAVLVDGRQPAGGVAVATLLGDPQSALLLAQPTCLPLATRTLLDRWSPATVITVGVEPSLTRTC